MAFRNRRLRRTSARRKTRWLAVSGGSQSFVANGTAFQQLLLADASGAVLISEFYGGTLSKLIVDITANVTPFPPDPTLEQKLSLHAYVGLFVTTDDVPSTVIWSPNAPSGDFMIRKTMGFWWNRLPETMNANMAGEAYVNYPEMVVETNVSRKLRENSRIFLGIQVVMADDTDLSQIDFGWTGRALFTLP